MLLIYFCFWQACQFLLKMNRIILTALNWAIFWSIILKFQIILQFFLSNSVYVYWGIDGYHFPIRLWTCAVGVIILLSILSFKRWWWLMVYDVRVMVMVFNATFNNISVISWRSALSVEETGVPGENHRPVANHWQTLSHNVVSSTPRLSGNQTLNVSGDRHWLHR